MGTLVTIMPVLGLVSGGIVSWLAQSEIKSGQKYFLLLQHALLGVILAVLLWKVQTIAVIAGIILFVLLYATNFKHPIGLMTLLAVPAILVPATQIPIFLYFVPTGTRNKAMNNTIAIAVYILIVLGYHLFF
ncbi:Uncharacterised protein [uncultured archaeon]|nr:Uncharacterised protein [uncultured archaeon]